MPPDDTDDRRVALLVDASNRLAECRRLLASQISEFESRARNADDLNSRLYHEVIASRMRPFGDGVQGFPRMVRDIARQLGKKVAFKIRGETTDVDRDILEKLESPLNHVLRNALDHGLEEPPERSSAGKPETCQLEVEARHNAGMLVITVSDDGRGIDLDKIRNKVIQRNLADERIARELSDSELLEFLFLPAFSTAKGVTEVSGRGVGLDVVHSMVQSVGGSVRIQSQLGQGTTFQLELPITLSVIRAVLVKIADEPYAFPHNRIDRLVRLSRNDLHSLENRQYVAVDGRNVGIVLASQILEMDALPGDNDDLFAILFSHHSDQYGLVVDEFCGERDLVVRPLDPRLGKVPNINAAAILDDGSPVLIVDLDDMRRSIERKLHRGSIGRAGDRHDHEAKTPAKRILVVDDSITVREVQRQLLVNHGYEVEVAVDGREGWNTLSHGQFDLVITDIDMPRLNGIDLVRMIKNDPQLCTTPVVIVSYKDREEDRIRGMEAGADYYLTKSSFHDEMLLAAAQDLIGEAH
jgi:two-component system sensor histidine kinase and response regulator WspE